MLLLLLDPSMSVNKFSLYIVYIVYVLVQRNHYWLRIVISYLFIKEIVNHEILIVAVTLFISSLAFSPNKVSQTNFRQEKYTGNTKEEAPHVERTLSEPRKYFKNIAKIF